MNPSTAVARVLVDELTRLGLTDLVVAPGSRSAPLAMAAHAEAVGGRGRLRLHVRVDERSAAYLALGLGKASGRPAAVVCTSGTAAANLHPAVVEASQAGVPLLVLTADRPPELRDTGANQTIDQVKLYGDAVRWFCEVGVPEARAGAVAYWRSLAGRAWALAVGDDAGPVHLNVALREPLTPDGSPDWPEPLDGRPGEAPWTEVARQAPPEQPVQELPSSPRGVLVLGDGRYDPAPYVALAEERGWPVLAEPTSGARYGPNALSTHHYLLSSPGFLDEHRPDLVVTAGKPSLSHPVLALVRGAGQHVAMTDNPGGLRWADPARTAASVLPGGSSAGTPAAARENRRSPSPRSEWLGSWLAADAAARAAVDAVLDGPSTGASGGFAAGGDVLTEPRLARDLAAALPDGALLFAGSSMPIRDLDRTMRPRVGLRLLGNRGASGIDGTVSAAVGAALAHGGPACALLGDLAVLHDRGGLTLGPDEPRPDLTVVVVNNDGGGIFSSLPQASHPEPFERVFGTPHGVDFEHVAAACSLPHERVGRPTELPDAVKGTGLRLVEVRTSRPAGAELHEKLQQAVDAAVHAG